MTRCFRGIFLLLLVWLPLISCGGKEAEDLDTRAKRLGEQIRCPVCRGVSIADSPSTLANEMMEEVREQIRQGKSDEDIYQFFVSRYGEWALLQPEPHGMNLLVWILPALVMVGGGVGIVIQVRKRKKEDFA